MLARLRSLWRGLRHRAEVERDVDDEMKFHLEARAAEWMRRGVSREEARRRARLEFGAVDKAKEETREARGVSFFDSLLQDLRFGARTLRKSPEFTIVAVATLALAIGANTAIFSVIDRVLLKPLPYPHSEQLVSLRHTAPGINIPDLNIATSLYLTYSDENRVFQDIAMWAGDSWTVTGSGEPEQVPGLSVTHGFLSTLGLQPELGRSFTIADENPDGERTAILTNSYWTSRFGRARDVVGRSILLDGNSHTVIGVLPPSFQFMDRKVSIIAPLRFKREETHLIGFCCDGFARLKPGVTLAQANADVARMLPMAAQRFPMNPGWSASAFADARISPRLRPLKDRMVGDIGKTLWVLMSAVGILLLIASANVANLFLVRTDGRRQELAIRAALGAGARRIARELVVESLLLCFTGGALGLALAYAALRLLVASDVTSLPRIHEISIHPSAFIFTFGISLSAGLALGLVPAAKYARPHVADGLRSEGRSLTGNKERQRVRSVLIAVQVALALVLLIGSGLMIQTFLALHRVDPGFSAAEQIETMEIGIPDSQIKDPKLVAHAEEDILRKIETVPGVSMAGAISDLPLEGGENDPIYAEDRRDREAGLPPVRRFKYVSPGYFAAAGSRLVVGRDLTWSELYNESPLVLVSENLARELWGDPRAAIGKRVRIAEQDEWRAVIGVVADLHDDGIDQKAPAVVYFPLLLNNSKGNETVIRGVEYIVRTPRAGSTALRQEIQAAVGSVNSSLAVSDVKTLQSVYDKSLARSWVILALLAIAGAMALLLGVVGIYGVISYSVSQRTREIGIRLALGAQRGVLQWMFVRSALTLASVGIVAGLIAACLLVQLMNEVLFGVRPFDLRTFIAVPIVLGVATAVASYIPARRAMRVDTMVALRHE